MSRRVFLRNVLGSVATLLVATGGLAQVPSGQTKPAKPPKTAKTRAMRPHNIKIRASKFSYSPNHITIYQNEQVVLELTSIDAVHGFSIPDLNVRSDIPPGQTTMVPITPTQIGELTFLCDNFCGDGHEKMQGKITVIARPA